MLSEYRVRDGQSLFDVSIQCYGNIDQVYRLIEENLSVLPNGLETDLAGGTILIINDEHIVDETIVNNLKLTDRTISTGN